MRLHILYILLILFIPALLFSQAEEGCQHPDTSKAQLAYKKGMSLIKKNPLATVQLLEESKNIYADIECWSQVVRMSYNRRIVFQKVLKDMDRAAEELAFAQAASQLHLSDSSKWKGLIALMVGEDFMRKRSLDTAKMYLWQAKLILKNAKDWKNYVKTCRTLAQMALYAQNYKYMERYIDEAFNVTKEKLHNDKQQVQSILQLYGALYYRTGDYETALERTEEGLEIVLANMQSRRDTIFVASYYNNMGLFYIEIGDIGKAEDYCNNALNLSLQLDDNYKAATIYLNLAEFFYKKRQFKKAYSYFEKGLEVMEDVNAQAVPASDIARTRIQANMGLARAGYQIGQVNEVFEALQRNLKLHKQEPYKLEMTYELFGEFYRKENKLDKAEEYLQKSIDVALKLYPEKKHPDLADIYMQRGLLARDQLEYDKSRAQLQLAEEALILGGGDITKELSAISDKEKLLEVIKYEAELLLADHKLEEAYRLAIKAAALTDKMRNSYKTAGSKLFFLQQVVPLDELILEITYQLYQQSKEYAYLETAFDLVEKSKAMLLLDALRTDEARHFGDVPKELLKEERRLARELAKKEKSLFEAKAANQARQIEQLQQEILQIKRKSQKLQDTLEANYYDYYELRYEEKTAGLKEVQQFLKKGEVVLEYFVGNEALYLFAIYRNQVKLIPFEKGTKFSRSIRTLRLALTNNNWINSGGKDLNTAYNLLIEHATDLYAKYVQPALDKEVNKMIIIPDGLLNYIPFEVLLTEKVVPQAQVNFKDLPYLIKKYSVNYHYSATLMLYERAKSRSNGKILGFAPTYSYNSEIALNDERQRSIRENVDELPGAKAEVEGLSSIFHGKFYYGTDANEGAFKKEIANSKYSIIHLAMHGWVDETRPQYSNLVFSHVENEEDNLLHAYELNLLELHTDLVVLSACETGFGKYERGEGVVSIGRGFMYAGVSSLVMTLWPINDHATSKIMTDFYAQLAAGQPKDQAMRQAKLNYLESASPVSSHPFFWASFITLGDPQPISLRHKGSWTDWLLWIGLGLLVIAVTGYAAGRVRKKKAA